MTLREELIAALIKAHIPSPRLEADIILKKAAPEYPEVSLAEKKQVMAILARRQKYEPLDKIIGVKEFYKYTFCVNGNVLSPRPDTETLVESALSLIPESSPCRIIDLGTGSGCILLSLLKERPQASGVGVDISSKALSLAAKNAALLGVKNRVAFINKSWQEKGGITECFDFIVSNPPYIPSREIASLAPEVKNYDPLLALDGGSDGYDCYKQIAAVAPLILKKGGYILLEAGKGQDEDIVKIFTSQGLIYQKTVPDLAGINRCVILKK